MAAKKAKKAKRYIVRVKNNPEFCGIGAGGVQFSYGEAKVASERMASWFKEHNGYEVQEEEVEDETKDETKDDSQGEGSADKNPE